MKKINTKELKRALVATVPVMTGYIVLGIGFGVIMHTKGYSVLFTFLMSAVIYAGSMQFVAIDLLTGGASLLVTALTTLMVNARHLFYGISMIDKYKGTGAKKPYLIFALTDETYSLVCSEDDAGKEKHSYYFFVSLLDHIYWMTGGVIGALLGSVIPFNTEGIDFALTALFVTVFVDQWLNTKKHLPAIIGVASSVLCLVIFGSNSFLIPSMIIITVSLSMMKKAEDKKNA